MVDLGGYVIILVETKDKKVKLYGSPAEKADLEVADEILEINGQALENSSHTAVIAHIHNCIKSRTICLRVKRRTGNKLAKELAESCHVQDAFVIAVEQQAKERLERLSALRKIKPVDMTTLSQQLCESPPSSEHEKSSTNGDSTAAAAAGNNTIYSAPVSELGSTANLNKVAEGEEKTKGDKKKQQQSSKDHLKDTSSKNETLSNTAAASAGGYVTDEELELRQTLEDEGEKQQQQQQQHPPNNGNKKIIGGSSQHNLPKARNGAVVKTAAAAANSSQIVQSPSREVLIADDNSRRSSRASIQNSLLGVALDGNGASGAAAGATSGHNADRKTSIKNGHQHLKMAEEEAKLQKEKRSKAQGTVGRKEGGGGRSSHHHHHHHGHHHHKALGPTLSLKAVVDPKELISCATRLQPLTSKLNNASAVSVLADLLRQSQFQRLLNIHNTIQSVQCFQCPPVALCSDSRNLVEQCSTSLQESALPEAAEILQILQRIELENLLFAHDKLAERQSALPWEKCVAEMWTKDRTTPSSSSNTKTSNNNKNANSDNIQTCSSQQQQQQQQHPPQSEVQPSSSSSSTQQQPAAQSIHQSATLPLHAKDNASSLPSSSSAASTLPPSSSNSLPTHHHQHQQQQQQQQQQQPPSHARDVTRVVKIMKQNEPLGATVRNEGERVVIGRVVKGGAAERSAQLFPGDEVLEVNGLKLKGKSVHDICDTLCQMTGTLTFVIIPGPANKSTVGSENPQNQHHHHPSTAASNPHQQQQQQQPPQVQMVQLQRHQSLDDEVLHFRAHFNYNPDDDLYIPCHELGISFQRGDILHVINREDQHWWQAYRDGEWTQTLAGLIPSLALQQHRVALQRQKREQDLKEQRELERQSPAKKKSGSTGAGGSGGASGPGGGSGTAASSNSSGSAASSLLCARKSNKRKRLSSPFKKADKFEIPPYEEMSLYYPQANVRRPLILVGPPSIGRHELRLRLLEDVSRFAAAVPHTSRSKGDGEIDGQDYNFVSRSQFEEYVGSKRFVEHGEFEKQYYGTSLDAVRTVINSGKICVLNLQPSSLQILHDSDLKPYVVFLTPPSLQTYRQQRQKYGGDTLKEEDYRDSITIATDMEEHYGHLFDSVIPFNDVDYVYEQLLYEINLLEREPQWVPAKWIRAELAGKVPLSATASLA